MAEYKIENTEIVIFGIKKNIDGNLNIAGQTELYSKQTGLTLGKTSTDQYGYWEFRFPQDIVLSGRYEIRFYGSGSIAKYQPEGDWEVLDVVSSNTEALIINNIPTSSVTEEDSEVDINKSEWAVGLLSLTDINISSGKLLQIDVYYKLSADVGFEFLTTIPVEVVSNSLSMKFRFPLKIKEANYDFTFVLKNGAGIIGRYLDTGASEILKSGITFNGVNDLSELHEVIQLEATNAVEGGSLITDFIGLKWIDLKTQPRSFFTSNPQVRDGYTGTMHTLTFEMAQRIVDYRIYMFVSDTESGSVPTAFYPRGEAGWYFVAKTTNAIIDVRVPRNKWVSFWVGFSMSKTVTQITEVQYEF